MPRFSPEDIDRKRKELLRKDMKTTAAMLDELMVVLRRQEYRLRIIEEAVDGWSILEHGNQTATMEEYAERLERVQQACPWDDVNAEDSWFFTEEEARNPVRIRED